MRHVCVESSNYNTDRLDRTIKGCSRLSYKVLALLAKEAVQVLWGLVSLVPGW